MNTIVIYTKKKYNGVNNVKMKRLNRKFLFLGVVLFFVFLSAFVIAMPKDPSIPKEFPESDLSHREFLLHKKMDIDSPTVISNLNVQGTKKILVILIKAKDQNPSYDTTYFQNLLFSSGTYSTGSFVDYFSEVSTGKLNITGSVVGWYTASQDYSYYTNGESGLGGFFTWPRNAVKLAGEAVDAAYSAGVDFSQFDNDKNGEIDGVLIVHPGPGAESLPGALEPNNIWSHKWSLTSGGDSARTYSDITINEYAMTPEKNGEGNLIEIGVFCHEFGHLLGLPDLYDTNDKYYGIGFYDLMSSGAWGGDGKHPEIPTHLSAWSKYYLGWAEISNYTGENGEKNLALAEGNNGIVKIDVDGNNKEYFLLCNRQKVSYDQYLPGSGLLIWHVDENRIDANWPDLVSDPLTQGVTLMEADGMFNLQKTKSQGGNKGDAGDFFPGSSNNTVFSATGNPSSNKNDGDKSGVSLVNIRPSSTIMSFTLMHNLGLEAAPSSGYLPLLVNFTATADIDDSIVIYDWDFDGDGTYDISTVTNTISYIYKTTGIYTAKVKVVFSKGITAETNIKILVRDNPPGNIDASSSGSENRVDGHDLYCLTMSFGSGPGDPNWNPMADLDNNLIIDGDDLIILTDNFGETY